jgi:hypothetical protein
VVAAGPRARPRVHLTGRRPSTTLAYHVRRGGVVRVVVLQVGCGRVAAFPIRAHRGTNTLRIRRTIKGRRLSDGTYRIRGRSHGTTVLKATIVIGHGGRAPCSLATVTSSFEAVFGTGIATAGGGFGSAGSGLSSSGSASSGAAAAAGGSGKLAAGKTGGTAKPPATSGVLGAAASTVLPSDRGTQLGLLIVLAAAIFLLTAGALPEQSIPHEGTAAFLVRRRAMIAVAGLTALTAFLISYFIT